MAPKPRPDSAPDQGQTFARHRRLLGKREFDSVLRHPEVRLRRGPLQAVARVDGGEVARLGLSVGRRVLPRAVDRNRAKRVIREAFRLCDSLPAADIVVHVLAPVGRLYRSQAERLFEAVAQRLQSRAQRQD